MPGYNRHPPGANPSHCIFKYIYVHIILKNDRIHFNNCFLREKYKNLLKIFMRNIFFTYFIKQFRHVNTDPDKRTHVLCALRLHAMHCFPYALFIVNFSERTQHVLSKSSSESDCCCFLDFDLRPLLVESCGSVCVAFFFWAGLSFSAQWQV